MTAIYHTPSVQRQRADGDDYGLAHLRLLGRSLLCGSLLCGSLLRSRLFLCGQFFLAFCRPLGSALVYQLRRLFQRKRILLDRSRDCGVGSAVSAISTIARIHPFDFTSVTRMTATPLQRLPSFPCYPPPAIDIGRGSDTEKRLSS